MNWHVSLPGDSGVYLCVAPAAEQILFAHIVQRPDDDVELDVACLLLGEDGGDTVDVAHYLHILDRYADMTRETMAKRDLGEFSAIRALNQTLFGTLGFRGNHDDYYDPRNSFLHQVIDRRTGIPITMTVLYMEVARRIGVTIHGVGFPGHFLARYDEGQETLIIDPFSLGMVIGKDDLESRLRIALGTSAQLSESEIAPSPKSRILLRVLANLAAIHDRNGDALRSLGVLQRMQVLSPDDEGIERELAKARKHALALN